MIAQKKEFAEADRKAARNMVDAAASEDLERIIYLGGLAGAQDTALSKHLQSRIEVADILQAGPVPTTDLRAPMILGSGSASFEILRYLVERLPVMVTPKWIFTRCQPIAIRDLLDYLIAVIEEPKARDRILEIGTGTGFFVEGGRLVTNHHVVDRAYRVEAILAEALAHDGPSLVEVVADPELV